MSFNTPPGIPFAMPSSAISAGASTKYWRQVVAARCHLAEFDTAPRKVAGASDHTIVWAEFDYGSRTGRLRATCR